MGIKLIAMMHCKSDAEETMEQELKRLVDASVQESGCLKYELYQHKAQRCYYIFIEEWLNEDALNRHKESSHYKYFNRIAPVLLEKPVEIISLTRLV